MNGFLAQMDNDIDVGGFFCMHDPKVLCISLFYSFTFWILSITNFLPVVPVCMCVCVYVFVCFCVMFGFSVSVFNVVAFAFFNNRLRPNFTNISCVSAYQIHAVSIKSEHFIFDLVFPSPDTKYTENWSRKIRRNNVTIKCNNAATEIAETHTHTHTEQMKNVTNLIWLCR